VPQICLAGASPPVRQAWRLSHSYHARGRYVASVSVYVNCTRDHVMVTVPVDVR